MLIDALMPGVRYAKGKFYWTDDPKEVKKNVEMDDDARTFLILRQIADSIDPDIQWEEDVASNHETGMLPCLDMEIWFDTTNNRVLHQFYKKSMSSKFLILKRSAVSNSTKRNAVFQEGIRRLMNCSPDLSWTQKAAHLSLFSHSMMISGYDMQFRRQIIKGVIQRYKQIEDQVNEGSRDWYRSRTQIKDDKLKKGGNNASTWHLKGDVRQTLQMPITPSGMLVRNVRDKINNITGLDGGKTMVLEMGGMPITAGIMKNDPFKPSTCRFGNANCLVDNANDCMSSNAVYKITCQEPSCLDKSNMKSLYIGQTGRSLHARAKEHASGLTNNDPKCPLTKHANKFHDDMPDRPNYKMEPIRRCRGNVERLLTESQWIGRHDDANLMNSKMEYGRNKMVRYRPTIDRV